MDSEVKIELSWGIQNEAAGNYKPPVWLKDARYKNAVDEIEFSAPQQAPAFTSAYQLVSLFRTRLTKGNTLVRVKITRPTPVSEKELGQSVFLEYKNGQVIYLKDLPMLLLEPEGDHEDHDHDMWYLNINLTDLVQQVERKE